MGTRKKRQRSSGSGTGELNKLKKVIETVLSHFPRKPFADFLDEINHQLNTSKRPSKELGWHEADPDLLVRESRLMKDALKPINGTPVVAVNAEGEVVVQGLLRINPTRNESIVMVYPRNFPQRPPKVFHRLDDSMTPIELGDPPPGWNIHETGLFMVNKVRPKLARNGKAKK